MTKQATARSQT